MTDDTHGIDPLGSKEQTELDEILADAFIGLWTRDSEGDFVSVVDSKNVLKDSLKVALLDWRDKAVREARIDELNDIPFEAGSSAEQHYIARIKALNQPEGGK